MALDFPLSPDSSPPILSQQRMTLPAAPTTIVLQAVRSLSTSSPSSLGLLGPAVKLIIHQYGLDAGLVCPTGPKKNILKGDVLSYIHQRNLTPKPLKATSPPQPPKTTTPTPTSFKGSRTGTSYTDIPLSNMRSVIAKRLSASKGSIPHAYLTTKIPADNVLHLRKTHTANVKLSLNDFVIKAAALALRAVPQVNSQWRQEEGGAKQMQSVDISVAVATPNGLITPIVKGADGLGVEEISNRVKEMATRAKENKLKPEEFQGGTFTISNLGMFGIAHFTAIINPPQAAILAVGGLETTLDHLSLQPQNKFSVTLCYDARVVDEMSAQRFLDHFQLLLSEPDTMLAGTDNFVDFNLEALL